MGEVLIQKVNNENQTLYSLYWYRYRTKLCKHIILYISLIKKTSDVVFEQKQFSKLERYF
jgi:hypothetical protein